MVKKLKMKVYIVDTSYLCELFALPNCSDSVAIDKVRTKFEQAIIDKSSIYVPIPCIFELANHISGISNGHKRREKAIKLYETIKLCVDEGNPWILTPSIETKKLLPFYEKFANNFVQQKIGLTDTFIIEEANRFKNVYKGLDYQIHIWTRDDTLKSNEPHAETDSFV